ncbi:hypothetical protein Aph01nite_76050 [Acrocarpospora phusangensis]|uniref:Uncharacterized protein n=1 Tax=Acrocarpospora phusangensis TaxID=1070424 RepID=A0A919QKT3_9ACTN|nr:hypothetical protein [Acrocarpospora phusangensis]GIH29295.1 hypothetical protein Aph01nite_76050 [Acrocarpospora phusangensis]
MNATETEPRAPEQDENAGRGALRRATALAGLGSIADVAAVAQLVTSGSQQGILVAGLLSVLAGLLGLLQLIGRPIGFRAMVMVALIAIGAGVTGAMIPQFLDEPQAVAAAPSSPPDKPAATTPSPTPSTPTPGASTPGTPTPSALAEGTPAPGEVLREAEATMRDQDYLDVESGKIGVVDPATSDLWYVSPYRSLWTAGGGEYPITTVDGRPGPAGCADAVATRDYDLVEVGKMRAGDWACARTAEGNLVGVRILAVPAGDAPLKISYVVWSG